MYRARKTFGLCVLLALFGISSCSKTIGWGLLLWYTDDPAIPSGTVLPVYGRSNIEQLWITGIPASYRTEGKDMMEVPLSHLELLGSRGAAQRRAKEFAEYAKTYAETMQDGLPVRDLPENNSRRVYRLKRGEVVKVLEKVEGASAISTTGTPLQGEWLKIVTQNGTLGYCFSYRLSLFEHETGPLLRGKREIELDEGDGELDLMSSRPWHPKAYGDMIASGKINLDLLSKRWRFDAGIESGAARVFLENMDLTFPYTGIKKKPDGVWVFEGSSLEADVQSKAGILVSFNDQKGMRHSVSFTVLPESLDTLIRRENERRQTLFQAVYVNGPAFHSVNYGTITFSPELRFSWNGLGSLPPGMISGAALESGAVDMGRFLEGDLAAHYTGALALVFDTVSGPHDALTFLYSLENQGLRLEHVPEEHIREGGVLRSGINPLVIYFSSGDFV